MVAQKDAAELIAHLHHEALVRLCRATGRPLQGISHGARLVKATISPRMARRLREWGITAAIARHITTQHVEAYLRQLDDELAPRAVQGSLEPACASGWEPLAAALACHLSDGELSLISEIGPLGGTSAEITIEASGIAG